MKFPDWLPSWPLPAWPFFGTPEEVVEQDKYIIVPPIMMTDRLEANRMAYSSFDWAFRKRQLHLLLRHFLEPGAAVHVNFVPPADSRLLISTRVALPNLLANGWHGLRPGAPHSNGTDAASLRALSDLQVRGHPDPLNRHSFAALSFMQEPEALGPMLHFAYLHPSSRAGVFANVPVHKPTETSQLGARYASPTLSSGLIANPARGTIDKAWLLYRHRGVGADASRHITYGIQLEPDLCVPAMCAGAAAASAAARRAVAPERFSVMAEYQAGEADSFVSVALGLDAGRVFRCSVFQHLARVRRVYNLFEDDEIIGITNYLDFGLVFRAPVASVAGGWEGGEASECEAAASWQVNSNVMIKAGASNTRVNGAVVFKSWWSPSFTMSLMGGWDLARGAPCGGLSLHIDNDSELRYERGMHTVHTGSLVRQKHVATRSEVMVAEGDLTRVGGRGPEGAAQDAVLLAPPVDTPAAHEVL